MYICANAFWTIITYTWINTWATFFRKTSITCITSWHFTCHTVSVWGHVLSSWARTGTITIRTYIFVTTNRTSFILSSSTTVTSSNEARLAFAIRINFFKEIIANTFPIFIGISFSILTNIAKFRISSTDMAAMNITRGN